MGRVLPDSIRSGPDLRLIVTAWGQLPDIVKAGIVAMIHAVEGEATR